MAITPAPAVRFGPYGNTGTLDITKFSRTGSTYTNSDTFQIQLQQNLQSGFDILFGDDTTAGNALFGTSSNFESASSMYTSSAYGDVFSGTSLANTSGVSPVIEMVARANLIGKTVDAIDPTTKKTFSGKVESVKVDGGILLINVGGTLVPPENLVQVSE